MSTESELFHIKTVNDNTQTKENKANLAKKDKQDIKKENNTVQYPDLEKEIEQFSNKPIIELVQIAHALGLKNYVHMNKQDLFFRIMEKQLISNGFDFIVGTLELMDSGFGFLRQSQSNFSRGSNDIYISPALVKQYQLKKGDTIAGFIKEPKNTENNKPEKFKALQKIVSINYKNLPLNKGKRISFDSLVPIYPDDRFNLESKNNPSLIATRIMDLFAPIGKGQRSLIVAPPRTGKTIMLQNIANALVENHPDIYLIVLLIDERPEEVTDMQRSVRGEVISSTFDEEPDKHCHVAEIVLEKAKRLVETGLDVVILLDSITRLARAYNQNIPASGKVLSGGVDAKALIGPKKFFGAARNIEKGGSLTIIGTSLIETGSRMDEVIFEEFKGTGNMEINLDRSLAERRVFPAIDIFKSGTRKEELLLTPQELDVTWNLREQLSNRKTDPSEIMKILVNRLKEFKTNKIFLESVKFTTQASRSNQL